MIKFIYYKIILRSYIVLLNFISFLKSNKKENKLVSVCDNYNFSTTQRIIFWNNIDILNKIKKNNVEGDFVECGVYKGITLVFFQKYIEMHKLKNIKIYASNHDFYINEIVSIIKLRNMNIKAPHMNSGDILFWNSRTVHGSLDSQSKINSRSSITLHAIPETHKLMQFQSRLRDLETDDLKNSLIHRPKDQSKFINRLIFAIESNFPSVFYWIKKQAIKSLFKKN